MAYRLVHHERQQQTRFLAVLVNPADHPSLHIIESFNYPITVPLATVRAEVKAILDAKYNDPDQEQLPGVGTDF